ncbi:hypothetical protein [Granulicella sibirica]|uniref:hypothetical protein n=1 Tax=Granulicella sibirica TaxID=2479048 RepID=UPI0010089757|nr:hypothetical protein [Granulicella sibirica]
MIHTGRHAASEQSAERSDDRDQDSRGRFATGGRLSGDRFLLAALVFHGYKPAPMLHAPAA